mmetsp:Transcript_9815/g.29919  ORF Transcript_9815/g.29919 Transcript_9815/m.29919 type:complete len:226 (-) Transcript_9815:78-755(-)
MAASMVENKSLDQPTLFQSAMFHGHYLYHVKVNLLSLSLNCQYSICYDLCEHGCILWSYFCCQGAPRNLYQKLTINWSLNSCFIDPSTQLLSGNVKSISDGSRMESFAQVSLSLLQQLPDQQNSRRGTITTDIILCRRRAGDHGCRRVLNLHFIQENIAVLCDLNISRSRHQHLNCALGAQVRSEHILQAFCSRDRSMQRQSPPRHLRARVHQTNRHRRPYFLSY